MEGTEAVRAIRDLLSLTPKPPVGRTGVCKTAQPASSSPATVIVAMIPSKPRVERPRSASRWLAAGILAGLVFASRNTLAADVVADASRSIGEALRDANRDGVPDRLGETVTLVGTVVSAPMGLSATATIMHLEDATGGIELFTRIPTLLLGRFQPGDLVEVTGTIDVYRQMPQLTIDTLRRLGTGAAPSALDVAVADVRDPRYLSRLVRLRGEFVVAPGSTFPSTDFQFRDQSGTVLVLIPSRFLSDAAFGNRMMKGGVGTLVGIVSRQGATAAEAQYRVAPRAATDIAFEPASRTGTIMLGIVAVCLAWSVYLWVHGRRAAERANALAVLSDHLKQSEEALRLSDERRRFVLAATGIGIWESDFAAGSMEESDSMAAVYGIAPSALPTTYDAFLAFVHPDDRERVESAIARGLTQPDVFTVDFRSIAAPDQVRWIEMKGSVVPDKEGKPTRVRGVATDITGRTEIEAQVRQAQKMEAIGQLAGGVAHDFNNLLTAILGYCELLLADFDPGDPRQADIAEIQKAGTSAAGLTRQLLAFSRKEIIEPTLLDLNALLSGMRAMLGRLIREDVKVVLRLRPELALVEADRGQVEQIILNLALNARDAMPTGGTLTIQTANVECYKRDDPCTKTDGPAKPGPYVVLTVTDTGIGMTPEVQARLFEPFFTTKEPGQGTGLGLATVHSIIERSGGRVDVSSELGKGTSFKVYFPQAAGAARVAETPPPVAGRRAGMQTVLVVEDADGLRELARRLLQRLGYTVLVAANADEALRLCDRHPSIDVILTDVVMPETSGPELARLLFEKRPELKVIYMSGYTEDAIVHHGVLNPGIAFLHKPFTSDTLALKLREVLDQPEPDRAST
jgi:PAS domain S-box-containing protein